MNNAVAQCPGPASRPSSRGLPAEHNPFCIDRLESLAFRPHDPALTPQDLVQRFHAARWHGAVVGPHGSGKSTLLRQLAAQARDGGRRVLPLFVNRQSPRRTRRAQVAGVMSELARHPAGPAAQGPVVACDGWCHLPPWERRRLRHGVRAAGGGVLGLAHLCGWGLPVIYRTRTTPALLATLVDELHPHAGLGAATTQAAWKRSRGNVRAALLSMYDRSAAGGTPGREAFAD